MDKPNKHKKPVQRAQKASAQKINPNRLKNKATHYLGRYASTEHKLTQILLKFAQRKWPEITQEEALIHIVDTVKWCREYGFVNDADYLQMKLRSGRQKGQSALQIKQKLFQAGLTQEMVATAFMGNENMKEEELQAAFTLARKKRIGPFSASKITEPAEKTKQIARLARAGFSYDICKKIFDYLDES